MKTLDALQEVSHEMQLLAHYLRMVSRDGGAGAETADRFSRKILELRHQIEEGLQILTPELRTTAAPFGRTWPEPVFASAPPPQCDSRQGSQHGLFCLPKQSA